MENLPPRPKKDIKPRIDQLTNDPFLRMILAAHYDVPEKDVYREMFQDEQEEIIMSLHDMGFQLERNDESGIVIINDVTAVAATATDPASSSGEERNTSTEQSK